ncbi:MAG: bifunctional 5,10-methylenetetrahydrofolate dehydrogenase/5,10-methenyltetrahydrofolate cyclohydrolase [Rickettsiales bacterium]
MQIIDCVKIANKIIANLEDEITKLNAKNKITLVILYTSNNPATMLYIGNKQKIATKLGINAKLVYVEEENLPTQIELYNYDNTCHGIIVQLPLSKSKPIEIAKLIDPKKDVDGFCPENVGKLSYNDMENTFVPCTAMGCLAILKEIYKDLSGIEIVIVGRSNIVGKPLAYLLTNYNATVTLAHSKTKNLKEICKRAEVVITAIGSAKFFDVSYFNSNTIVIDVGINYIEIIQDINSSNHKDNVNNMNSNSISNFQVEKILCGDVNFSSVINHVRAITPVPRGVGPLTIAYLMSNTVLAYKLLNNIKN